MVTLEINGIKLSMEEAKELYVVLKQLFDKPTPLPTYPVWVPDRTAPVWTSPYVVECGLISTTLSPELYSGLFSPDKTCD